MSGYYTSVVPPLSMPNDGGSDPTEPALWSGRGRFLWAAWGFRRPPVDGRSADSARLGGGRLGEGDHLATEVVDVLEALVDAGEAQVGDMVELFEPAQDGEADRLGAELGTLEPQLLLDVGGQLLELRVGDRTVLGRRRHP